MQSSSVTAASEKPSNRVGVSGSWSTFCPSEQLLPPALKVGCMYAAMAVVQVHVPLASYPGSFPLTGARRKEPGNVGGFKPFTSGA